MSDDELDSLREKRKRELQIKKLTKVEKENLILKSKIIFH